MERARFFVTLLCMGLCVALATSGLYGWYKYERLEFENLSFDSEKVASFDCHGEKGGYQIKLSTQTAGSSKAYIIHQNPKCPTLTFQTRPRYITHNLLEIEFFLGILEAMSYTSL
jgi:hypothetical protein